MKVLTIFKHYECLYVTCPGLKYNFILERESAKLDYYAHLN